MNRGELLLHKMKIAEWQLKIYLEAMEQLEERLAVWKVSEMFIPSLQLIVKDIEKTMLIKDMECSYYESYIEQINELLTSLQQR